MLALAFAYFFQLTNSGFRCRFWVSKCRRTIRKGVHKAREVNAIRKAVQITGDANLRGAIWFSKYDLRLLYAKG